MPRLQPLCCCRAVLTTRAAAQNNMGELSKRVGALDRRIDELPRLMREMGNQLLSGIAALDGRLPETVHRGI